MIDPSLTRALESALDRYLPKRGVPARLQAAMRSCCFFCASEGAFLSCARAGVAATTSKHVRTESSLFICPSP